MRPVSCQGVQLDIETSIEAMSNLKPIYVTLKETRHKKQPWVFVVDRPGPQSKETKQERYSTQWSAKRGAAYKLTKDKEQTFRDLLSSGLVWDEKAGKHRPVKFIIDKRK
jgi:hypothetical protein